MADKKSIYASLLILVIGLSSGLLIGMNLQRAPTPGIFNPTIDGRMDPAENWDANTYYSFFLNLDEEHEDTKNFLYVNYTEDYVYILFDFCGDITDDELENEFIVVWIDTLKDDYQYEWQPGEWNGDHYDFYYHNFSSGDTEQLDREIYTSWFWEGHSSRALPEVSQGNALCRILEHETRIGHGTEVIAYNLTAESTYLITQNFYVQDTPDYIATFPHVQYMGPSQSAYGKLESSAEFEIAWGFGPSINSDEDHRIFEIKIDASTLSNYSVERGVSVLVQGYGTAAFLTAESIQEFGYYSTDTTISGHHLAKESAFHIAAAIADFPHYNSTIVEYFSMLTLASYQTGYYPF